MFQEVLKEAIWAGFGKWVVMVEAPSVDPTGDSGVASELAAVADEVAALYAKLTVDLAALGEPWGDDARGRAFAQEYVPKSNRTLAAGQALVDNMRALSADIAAAERGLVNQDQISATPMGGHTFGNAAPTVANDGTTGSGTTAPTNAGGQADVAGSDR